MTSETGIDGPNRINLGARGGRQTSSRSGDLGNGNEAALTLLEAALDIFVAQRIPEPIENLRSLRLLALRTLAVAVLAVLGIERIGHLSVEALSGLALNDSKIWRMNSAMFGIAFTHCFLWDAAHKKLVTVATTVSAVKCAWLILDWQCHRCLRGRERVDRFHV